MTDIQPRSGAQIALAGHGYTATIASIGATLRELRFEGRELVASFDADEVRPVSRGVTLAPWPNRIADGRYRFAGEEHQLPLTEPARQNALHGLACWLDFTAVETAPERVLLTATIEPQAGYPFRVAVDVEYALTPQGLVQTVTGRNVGADAAPWGTSAHPYLLGGDGRVDDWTLTLPAAQVLQVTEDRLLPLEVADVSRHPDLDFREPRAIADTFIDHAYTGLPSGTVTVAVTGPDGHGTAMSWDDTCRWVQIHTADTPGAERTHRAGLAVEPMTCPPDAFNSGTDLIVLEPGDSHRARWTIFAF
ncbi:aldose 1-epimerase family protein [Microbacterium gorillae]|uniref:aldose 1-epimerase family protein n=1 Tax=Microbacterium gorillae TaxID=1231063 RepID=UPI003D95C621